MKEQNYGDSQYKFRGRGAGGRKGRTWGAEKILRAVKLQLLTPTDPARPTWSADATLCLAGNNVSIRVLFTTSGRCSWQGQCVWGGGEGGELGTPCTICFIFYKPKTARKKTKRIISFETITKT